MKKIVYGFCALLVFSIAFVSCSDNKETAPEGKGVIEEMTDQAAKESVEKIRTPIEKARSVEDIQKDRLSNMENELKEKP